MDFIENLRRIAERAYSEGARPQDNNVVNQMADLLEGAVREQIDHPQLQGRIESPWTISRQMEGFDDVETFEDLMRAANGDRVRDPAFYGLSDLARAGKVAIMDAPMRSMFKNSLSASTKDISSQFDEMAHEISGLGSWASDGEDDTEKSSDSKADDKSEKDLSKGQGDAEEQKDVEESKSPAYDIDEMAGEFILGAWGNGQDRIDNMLNAGYTLDDYNKIQQRVNEAYASGRDLHEWTNKANEKLHYW